MSPNRLLIIIELSFSPRDTQVGNLTQQRQQKKIGKMLYKKSYRLNKDDIENYLLRISERRIK